MKLARAAAVTTLTVMLAVGGAPKVLATGSDDSTFIPITPCRLMDTRSTSTVGPRNTPIGAGETYSALVWGTNGNCTIPSTATAITLNVTFVNPTSAGFVTVYPPDQAWPGTSNLNFSAGQAPAPNGVTSPLSFDGKIGFFNAAGTVNLIADIVGYYEPSGAPDADTLLGACSGPPRWDLNHCQKFTYATGDNPHGIAFDGTSLWVANTDSDNVSKINPLDGTKVDYVTGNGPTSVAFDGRSIWVTNNLADTVSRIDPATGTKTDFATGDAPIGVAFDGTSVWVANNADDTVSKINPATGTKSDFSVGDGPMGVAFDGRNIWVVNNIDGGVSLVDPETGIEVTAFPTGNGARDLAFDGINMWVANGIDSSVSRVNTFNFASINFAVGSGPTDIAYDGTSIWVTASADGDVSKVNTQTGTYRVYSVGSSPQGIAFDGSNIWVSNADDDTVSKMIAGRGVMDAAPVGATDSSTFVPITPCRLMDTRSTSPVGPRNTPIGAGETYSAMVWGTNGNCTIPSSATAVSLNVTFVGPTSSGFVTVYPPDKPWPGTSNLNFSAGQAPAPNGVTSPLSFDGKIGFFNALGTVNLIADIVGYYEVSGGAPGATVFGTCGSLLRWDLPGCRRENFATGNDPTGIAFDGTSIWFVNEQDNTVTKMDPNTGAQVNYPTGTTPSAVMFDGRNIWVANRDSDTVSRINPATGARTDFSTGDGPIALAFDGTNVWASIQGAQEVSKIDRVSGAVIASYTGFSVPWGIAFDGTSLWIANYNNNTVAKMNPVDGSYTTYATGSNPVGVAFDGARIWVTNLTGNNVSRISPITGAKTDFGAQFAPSGIAFDGTNIWVANTGSDSISRFNISDGSRLDVPVGDGATGVAFDGGNIWVTNKIAKTISRLSPGASGMRLSGVTTEGASTFVPVTPCRLMDTRSTSTVGPRNTPIGAGETYSALVWGTNGNCTIPSTATALSLNVTFVGPTSSGFVTVYPPDKPWPGTSNLNFSAGQAPAPNGVTSPLSFDGKIGFFNAVGTVNLLADVVGYYEPVPVTTTRCMWILRWDLPECKPAAVATGDYSLGIAFDGSSIWVANQVDDTVSKINPATGTKVDYSAGDGAADVVFDGTFIWVTNFYAGTVSKINPATGAEIGEYATSALPNPQPSGITFDGTSIWVTNENTDDIAKINPADGTRTNFPTGDRPIDVEFDGTNVWVVNRNDDNVSKVDPASGAVLVEYATGDQPIAIAFDGTNLWIANVASDTVSKMNPVNGTKTDFATEDGPLEFAFDGISMWVALANAGRIARIDVTTGAMFNVVVGNNPTDIAFDGNNLWVTRFSLDLVMKVVI